MSLNRYRFYRDGVVVQRTAMRIKVVFETFVMVEWSRCSSGHCI